MKLQFGKQMLTFSWLIKTKLFLISTSVRNSFSLETRDAIWGEIERENKKSQVMSVFYFVFWTKVKYNKHEPHCLKQTNKHEPS